MIYIIKTAQYNKEHEFVEAIKLGYTDNWEKRKQCYEEYCHNYIVLFTYDEGTLVDESRLKSYFKKLGKIIYKREWLYYSEEVLEIFRNNNTIDKLRNFLDRNLIPKKNKVDHLLINSIMNKFYKEEKDLLTRAKIIKDLEEELKNIPSKYQYQYISEKFSISEDKLKVNVSRDSVEKELSEFESIKNTREKLKYLVKFTTETSGITEQMINNFLIQIPGKYTDYYKLLGPDRIKANGYLEADLRREWIKTHSEVKIDEEMIDKIYETFSVGEKYGKASIKSTLKNIYLEYNFNKTAKASDLTDYFVLKNTTVKENGEWVRGFEILGKK